MLNRRLGAATFAAVIVAGCGGDSLGLPGGDGEPDFDRLFAPATSAEIASVRAEWMSRNPAAIDARVEAVVATSFGGMQGEATIIGHRVDGNLHYGALFLPDGAPPDAPMMVFLHGGEGGVSLPQTDTDFLIGGLGPIRDEMAYLIPSFRSEELRVGGQSFRSEGSQSPWDRDVDDALALVRSAAALFRQSVDPGRVVTVGVGRGALVALLMAIRDPGIAGAIHLAGPTDFFGDFVRARIEEAARGDPRQVAGLAYLDSRFIQPWARGELTTEAFRLELVRRSAVLFGEDLPLVQVHHGTSDPVVAPSQAQSLISTMQALGRTPPGFESFLYSGAGHAITGFGAAPDRARAFLEELWFPAAAIADLQVIKSGPSQAAVDDTITYVIATRNEGPQSAVGVSLVDTLPSGAAFVRASRGVGASGQVIRWPELTSLASGGMRTDTVVAIVRSSGSLTGVATVTGVTTDPDVSDNRSSVTTSVAAPGPDLDALFAAPASGEISAVRSLWAGRSPSSQNPSLVQSIQTTSSGVTGQLHVIEHTVDGLRHYGSVFVPNGIASGSAPIIVFLHGGGSGVSTPGGDLDYAVTTLKNLSRDFVYVFPSFRGETLRVGSNRYRSEGAVSFWDRDVDDALALMHVVRGNIPQADPGRVATFGRSRGGLVAQLMGARDSNVDGVVSLMAPTDLFEPWAEGILRGLAGGVPPKSAFEDFLDRNVMQPFQGGQLSLADARSELIRRSSVLFASRLPWTQIHHGTADGTVAVTQAESLIQRMTSLGRSPPAFEGFLYTGAGHGVSQLTGSTARIRTFIETLWP